MTKQWIYKGECRNPKSEEHFIDIDHHPKLERFAQGVVRQVPPECVEHGAPYPIVYPIPDDVVMVPREKIETLKATVWRVELSSADGRDLYEATDAILACVEPKPEPRADDADVLLILQMFRDTLDLNQEERARVEAGILEAQKKLCKPKPPKDEILYLLKRERDRVSRILGDAPRSRMTGPLYEEVERLDRAISLRERELKERER